MSALLDFLSATASWAWRVSLEAAVPMVLLLALARLRWLPARWTGWLCVILFARLLLPAVPAVTWRPDILPAAAAFSVEEPGFIPATDLSSANTDEGLFADSAAPLEALHEISAAQPQASFTPWRDIFGLVWLGGVVLVFAWLVRSHLVIRGWAARAESPSPGLQRLWDECLLAAGCRVQVPLRVTSEISTVAVHGLLRPGILAPPDLEERCSREEIRSMFLHETAHLRRHDVLWVTLGLAGCALHWFNPLAWLVLRRFTQDREVVCDDHALSLMGRSSRRDYGGMLLRFLEAPEPAMPASAASFFRNHQELKHRLNNIMKPNRTTLWSRIVATLAMPAVCALTLTTASADGEKKDEPRGERDAPRKEEEVRKPGARDGEREGEKRGPRDGEVKKEGPRDGEREGEKRGPRDGEVKKEGPRDGEREGEKRGPRDGEMKKEGERDEDAGDRPRKDGGESSARDLQEKMAAKKRESLARGITMKKPGADKPAGAVVVSLDADGNVVSSDGWVVPADTVRSKLQSLAQANPDQAITLRASSSAPLDRVMSVLQIMKDAGIKNVNMGAGK